MSASQTYSVSKFSDSLLRLKQQRELSQKPFPLWALLVFCEVGNRADWYCNYFEGLKLLIKWLGPVEIPAAPSQLKIPRLHRTYEIQEIAVILKTSQENIYHGYSVTFSKLFIPPNTPFMPSQIPTETNGG